MVYIQEAGNHEQSAGSWRAGWMVYSRKRRREPACAKCHNISGGRGEKDRGGATREKEDNTQGIKLLLQFAVFN